METKKYIKQYTGYRHNRYDGYNSSWGVLMGLGGTPTADCFADDDDFPDAEMDERWETGDGFDIDEMLSNLDISNEDFDEILELESDDDPIIHTEYWGNESVNITFQRIAENICITEIDSLPDNIILSLPIICDF